MSRPKRPVPGVTYNITVCPALAKPAFSDSGVVPPLETAALMPGFKKLSVPAANVRLTPLGFAPGSGPEIQLPPGDEVILSCDLSGVGTVGNQSRYAGAWQIAGQATWTPPNGPSKWPLQMRAGMSVVDEHGRKASAFGGDEVTGDASHLNVVRMTPLPPTPDNVRTALTKDDAKTLLRCVGKASGGGAATHASIRNWLARPGSRKTAVVQRNLYLRMFTGDTDVGAIGMLPPGVFPQLCDEDAEKVANAADDELEDYVFGRYAPPLRLRADSTAAMALGQAQAAAAQAASSGTAEDRKLADAEFKAAMTELKAARAGDAAAPTAKVAVDDASDVLLDRKAGMHRECVAAAGGHMPSADDDVVGGGDGPKVPRYVDSNGFVKLPEVCPESRIPDRLLRKVPAVKHAIRCYRTLRHLRQRKNAVACSVNGLSVDADAWKKGQSGGSAMGVPTATEIDAGVSYLVARGIERVVPREYVPTQLLRDSNRNFWTGALPTVDVGGPTDTVVAPVPALTNGVRLAYTLATLAKNAGVAQSLLAKGKTPLDPKDAGERARRGGKPDLGKYRYSGAYGGLGGGLPPAWPKKEEVDDLLARVDAWLPLATSTVDPRGRLVLGFKLTARQKAAFRASATDGVVVCQAGAGAGKTLLTAVIYLWQWAVILTFTSNAAHNIRKRVGGLLAAETRARAMLGKDAPPVFAEPRDVAEADASSGTRAVTTMAWAEDKARRMLAADPSTPEGQGVRAALGRVLERLRPGRTRVLAIDEAACVTDRLAASTLKAAKFILPRLCRVFLAGDKGQLDGVGSGTPMDNLCWHYLGSDVEAASDLLLPTGRPAMETVPTLRAMGAQQEVAWPRGVSFHILRRLHRFTGDNPIGKAIRARDPSLLADSTLPPGAVPDLSAFASGDAGAIASTPPLQVCNLPTGAVSPEDAAFYACSALATMTRSGAMPDANDFALVTWRREDVRRAGQCVHSALLGALDGVAPPTVEDLNAGRVWQTAPGAAAAGAGAGAGAGAAADSDSEGEFDLKAMLSHKVTGSAPAATAPGVVAAPRVRTLRAPWDRKRGLPRSEDEKTGAFPNLATIDMNTRLRGVGVGIVNAGTLAPEALFPGLVVMVSENDESQPDGPIYRGQTYTYLGGRRVGTRWDRYKHAVVVDPSKTHEATVMRMAAVKDGYLELDVADEEGGRRTIVLHCRIKNPVTGGTPSARLVMTGVIRTTYRAQGMQRPVGVCIVLSNYCSAKELYVGCTRGNVNVVFVAGDALDCIVKRGIIPSAGVIGQAFSRYLQGAPVADELLGKLVRVEKRDRPVPAVPRVAAPASEDADEAEGPAVAERLSLFGGAVVVEGMKRVSPPPPQLKTSPSAKWRHVKPPPPLTAGGDPAMLRSASRGVLHTVRGSPAVALHPRTPHAVLHHAPAESQQGVVKL